MSVPIERLAAHHARQHFDCGHAALNSFLRQLAGQQQRRGISKTYVSLAPDGTTVTGFVTVSAAQVLSGRLPNSLKLPRYPVPALRIGRLAVDRQFQGAGIGQDLLAFALQLALEFSDKVGLYAVIVDAKDVKACHFYQRLGFVATLDDPLCLFLPLATLAKSR